MEVIETVRGKPNLLHNGFSYRKYRENNKGEVTWVCLKEKSAKCKGRIVTRDNREVVRTISHDCEPDGVALEVKKAVFGAKKRAREDSDTPLRKVFQEEIESLQNKGTVSTQLPEFYSVKSSLYRNRTKKQCLQTDPKQLVEVVLEDETLEMAD